MMTLDIPIADSPITLNEEDEALIYTMILEVSKQLEFIREEYMIVQPKSFYKGRYLHLYTSLVDQEKEAKWINKLNQLSLTWRGEIELFFQ